jgi:hypothetical protein
MTIVRHKNSGNDEGTHVGVGAFRMDDGIIHEWHF